MNVFLGFILALAFLLAGFVGGDMLPFPVRYRNAPNLKATVYSVFADEGSDRIYAELKDGALCVRGDDGELTKGLIINTLDRNADKERYSHGGFNIVVDTRPAGSLAEVEAYCISNDGKETVISYEDYLTLSEVARLNFDFKLKYTGNELLLDAEKIAGYRVYLDSLGGEVGDTLKKLDTELAEGKTDEAEYNRAIYELYFTSYYPEISEYEASSKLPLLRNYYFHEYISRGLNDYLFIFDDYMSGAFESASGTVSFYGFYSGLSDGEIVSADAPESVARKSVDGFIKASFGANWIVKFYAYATNLFTLLPFIALMLLVAALLTFSVMRLRGVESISSLGAMLKSVGSFVWVSGLISAVLTVVLMLFLKQSLISALPLVLFFAVLVIRSVIFAIRESRIYAEEERLRKAKRMEEE